MTTDIATQFAVDRAAVETYLTHMYGGVPGLLGVCSDADAFKGRRFTTDPAGIGSAVDYVVSLDRRRPKGIYVQVTTLRANPPEGRGGEDLAHAVTYLWADGDFGTVGHSPSLDDLPHPTDEDTVRRIVLADAGLPEPTGWGRTGGGLNAMWMLAEPYIIGDDQDRARVKDFTTSAQAILGAAAYRAGFTWDVGVGDLARIMRLPGTVNRKTGDDRPTTVVAGSGAIYEFDELVEIVTRLAPAAHATMAQAVQEKQQRAAKRQQRLVPAPRVLAGPRRSGDGPLDVLADLMRFRDILEPAHFTFRGYHGDGRERYIRPAGTGGEASSAYSLLCNDHVAINWSERADLPVGALAPGQKLTIGTLYAHLYYGGNTSAAAKDVMRAAGGKPAQGAAGSLPPFVLAEVRRRCMSAPEQVFRQPPALAASDWEGMELEPVEDLGDGDPAATRRIPGLLPEEFYAAREVHLHIRRAGHSRNRSGDVAFLATLTRLSAMVSHHIRADTGVAGYASLNLFGGILGPSGIGKSTGADVADRLMPAPTELDFRDGLPIGSGEGMAEIFMDTVDEPTGEYVLHGKGRGDPITKKVRKQVRHNAFFWVDEGASLTRLMKERSGSTLGETLRSAAVGQTLGQTNASKDTTRYIPSGSYSLGLLVGFQPETAAPLFEEVAEGTPQRFWWMQVLDPSIPDVQPSWPGELTGWREVIKADRLTLISFDPDIKAELRRADLAKARGEIPPDEMNALDSHAPLMRVKFASLLALLAGRRHVNAEDWELSRIAWEASCAARDSIIEYSARQRQRDLEKVTQARITEAVRIEAAKVEAEAARDDKAVERAAQRVAYLVHENGAMTRSAIRDKVAGRQKKHINDAIGYAQLREWVEDDGKKIAPGRSRPS